MKARITLEFDLEDHDGNPVDARSAIELAIDHAREAIEARLMGEGFMPDEFLVGEWCVFAELQGGRVG